MKFQTLSVVTGTQICNASCPFCVSKMTSLEYVERTTTPINYRNFRKTLKLAEIGGVSTVIMTGKGEPFLYPSQILDYLYSMKDSNFPFIEIQTNGELLTKEKIGVSNVDDLLKEMYDRGVTSILLSNVGPDPELNRQIYFPSKKAYYNMGKLVDRIQKAGINVRLTTIGIKGGVDSVENLDQLVEWAKFLGVKQLTWRPVNEPGEGNTSDGDVTAWVKQHYIDPETTRLIHQHVSLKGTMLYKLVHGAAVYDYKGMNLCLTNCLTRDPNEDTIRQLIFFPDGGLYTDWAMKGSVLL
jgi:MoaA/NifB/PqqE/SkfB family radical SAM enzyme